MLSNTVCLLPAVLRLPKLLTMAVIAQLVKRGVSDGRVAGSWFDSQTGNALLCHLIIGIPRQYGFKPEVVVVIKSYF